MAVPTMLHACNDGTFLDLPSGNIYAYDRPHVATPAAEKVKDWRADLPSVALSPASVKMVKMLKESMAKEPAEHFLAVGIDRHGAICFEDWQEGDQVHADVDLNHIVQRARESQAQTVAIYHNHPDGSVNMSELDKQLTKLLERKLAASKIALLEHGIVPGHPEPIREAQRPMTSYDLKVQESERLWGRGGPPPMPWGRWSQRTVEALPSEYPRDGFDIESLTRELEERAREILHSVPLDVAKRIIQAVSQRLGVPA